MQSNDHPLGIKSYSFSSAVWTIVVNGSDGLIIDYRDEQRKSVRVVALTVPEMNAKKLKVELSWWEKIICVVDDQLIAIKYLDQKNPSDHIFSAINVNTGEVTEMENAPPVVDHPVTTPFLYEQGTEYHQTVSDFLAIELPTSCEYLEWGNKIIVSYYLRSKIGFDRYLLFLSDSEKQWQISQDRDVKGFSDGAFFVYKDNLIFIKNRNEVCVYPM